MARCPHSLLTSSSARSLHSEDFYGIALVAGVLSDEADYEDTEVMLAQVSECVSVLAAQPVGLAGQIPAPFPTTCGTSALSSPSAK